MYEVTEIRKLKGKLHYTFIDLHTLEEVRPKYLGYKYEDYIKDNILPIEPMTAKEEDNKEKLENYLKINSGYYAEEKLDGVRATIHFTPKGIRIFSRNISKESNWYNEYTDLVPHIRDLKFPKELTGMILDGELTIVGFQFKEVSSILNCNWEEALYRQIQLGTFISVNLFDIIRYKNGVYVARQTYLKRKKLLEIAVETLSELKLNPMDFLQRFRSIKYFDDYIEVEAKQLVEKYVNILENTPIQDRDFSSIPNLAKTLVNYLQLKGSRPNTIKLNKVEYYEYIVFMGGEGLILKNKEGKYYHKRGKEYIKIKKELTRDLVLMYFNEPTKEYTGKLPNDWEYYEDDVPVTKHYFKNWVGNMVLGVVMTKEEYSKLPGKVKKSQKFHTYVDEEVTEELIILEVCECSGFNEELREYFTDNQGSLVKQVVIEVLCNEIFSDTGKMRHPRFNRVRYDKNILSCTWSSHINE